MAHAYTPGLKVLNKTLVQKERILPLKGKVMKKVGDKVTMDEVVARTELPGNVVSINVVNLLGIQPQEINDFMLKKEGDKISKDEPMAATKPFIKWFKTEVKSPVNGTIESISPVTGQVLLREPPMPIEVKAYVDGIVTKVFPEEGIEVETVATFIQGIFGIGGEVNGVLKFAVNSPNEKLSVEKITPDFKGAIIVGGSFAGHAAIKKCIEVGAKGLIVGGIHDGDLRQILGYDLGVAITGSEDVGITLLLTEGFGEIAISEKSFQTLKKREGEIASISGATQIRAGVIRPEIIISFKDANKSDIKQIDDKESYIDIGSPIRVIRQPYFGKLGVVSALPVELQKIDSETHARVLEVAFQDGSKAIVPRANVEMIQG